MSCVNYILEKKIGNKTADKITKVSKVFHSKTSIINLLDNPSNQPSKFRTKNWVEINDESREA